MSQLRVHILQHVPFENEGAIAFWAKERGFSTSRTLLYENADLPSMDTFDFLVVMGGPMNIYEEEKHPWLIREKNFLKEAIQSQKKILGICLGAQLLSDVLGGKVTRNAEVEIGWFPLTKVGSNSLMDPFAESFLALHWHGDTFSIPDGGERLAESEGCPNQAFLYQNHVLALQYHLETTPENLSALIENCREEIKPGKYIQSEDEMKNHLKNSNLSYETLYALLDKFCDSKIDEGIFK